VTSSLNFVQPHHLFFVDAVRSFQIANPTTDLSANLFAWTPIVLMFWYWLAGIWIWCNKLCCTMGWLYSYHSVRNSIIQVSNSLIPPGLKKESPIHSKWQLSSILKASFHNVTMEIVSDIRLVYMFFRNVR